MVDAEYDVTSKERLALRTIYGSDAEIERQVKPREAGAYARLGRAGEPAQQRRRLAGG